MIELEKSIQERFPIYTHAKVGLTNCIFCFTNEIQDCEACNNLKKIWVMIHNSDAEGLEHLSKNYKVVHIVGELKK